MNKIYFIIIVAFIVTVFNGCKKDNDNNNNWNNNGSEISFTPENVPQTTSGIIQVTASSLILKVGESAILSAKLFDANGVVSTPQPGFTYTSESIQIATVNGSGNIVAVAVGETNITVTDGVHGTANVNVVIIPATGTPPGDVYNIVFTPPVLSLSQGGTGTFAYEIYDRKGNLVTPGTPDFVLNAASHDVTISGTTITSGSQTGVFSVLASMGGVNLLGTLQVILGIPPGSNTTTQYVIDEVYYPTSFNDIELTAKPVKVRVTETLTDGNGNLVISKYETSPDQITIKHSSVITNNGGRLKSVHPGYCKLAVTYKGAMVEGWSVVHPRLHDNWGSSEICLEFFGYNIISYFAKGRYNFNFPPLAFNFSLTCNPGNVYDELLSGSGKIDGLSGGENNPMCVSITSPHPDQWNSVTGKLVDGYFMGSCPMAACSTQTGTVAPSTSFLWKDIDHITLTNPSNTNNYTLGRNEGCGVLADTIDFGSVVSNNGVCKLTYIHTAVICYVSDDNITNDSLFIAGLASIDNMPGHNCASAFSTLPFSVKIPIVKNSSGKWGGQANFVYYDTFVFKLIDGTLASNGSTFTGTVEVTSGQWPTITRQITLTK